MESRTAWNAGKEPGEADAGRLLLSYYGDDFTGSTDVLEALSAAGLNTVLFLEPPDAALLRERFPDADCIGVAGVARSMSPQEMEEELRPILEKLQLLGARLVHYKVCSTFDSAPHTGSIGRAMELGRSVFRAGRFIPLLAGVPALGRYTLFGNHFAADSSGQVRRLDRHPPMARHPVTPMDEGDLRLHLSRQTDLQVALMDILALDGSAAGVRERLEQALAAGPDAVLFDVLDEQRLAAAGRLLWEESGRTGGAGLFAAGSSGIAYALTAFLRAEGLLPPGLPAAAPEPGPCPSGPLLVVSGSCSPVTGAQLNHALASGFAGIRVNVEELLEQGTAGSAARELLASARSALSKGRSTVLYTALGPDDKFVGTAKAAAAAQGLSPQEASRRLGEGLGELARELIREQGIRRLVVAGGDTSGYITRRLGVYALQHLAAAAPGAPLCRAASEDPRLDGLQLVLKGGQMGAEHFFIQMLTGTDQESESPWKGCAGQ